MITIEEKIVDISPTEQPGETWHPEAELICDYGRDSLAFFGLASENEHFLAPDGAGLVNYRLVGNVAVVLGDPVCPPEACEQVTQSFLDFCARQKWRVAFYQASPEHLAISRALNLHAFKMGEEAILHPQTFTLGGSAMANVRTSSRRAQRDGVILHWYEGVPPSEVMQHLEHVSSAWLEHKVGEHAAETGFSTGRLDELMKSAERADTIAHFSVPPYISRRDVPRFVTGVATTSAGAACAFVTFTPIYGSMTTDVTAIGKQSEMPGTNPSLQRHGVSTATPSAAMQGVGTNPSLQRRCASTATPSAAMQGVGWGWSLDLMRRAPDAPPGVMELLLVRAMERFRLCGAHVVSLGLVALADTSQEMTPIERKFLRLVTDRLHLWESHETLFNFKQKFHPCWESRYLVTNTRLALPKIALAVLRLRNYSGGGVVRLLPRSDKP